VPPNLKNPPAGCRFAERCKYVKAGVQGDRGAAAYEVNNRRAYRCIMTETELRRAYEAMMANNKKKPMPERDKA
jgi:peptide/nickel transport system ATP-binding protein